jgi:hypothetical protein
MPTYYDLKDDLIMPRVDEYEEYDEDENITEWLTDEYDNVDVASVNEMIKYFKTANPNDEANEHVGTFYKLFGHDVGCGSYISWYHMLETDVKNDKSKEIFIAKYLQEFMSMYRIWIHGDIPLNDTQLCELAIQNMQIDKINNLYFICIEIMC